MNSRFFERAVDDSPEENLKGCRRDRFDVLSRILERVLDYRKLCQPSVMTRRGDHQWQLPLTRLSLSPQRRVNFLCRDRQILDPHTHRIFDCVGDGGSSRADRIFADAFDFVRTDPFATGNNYGL